jgi:hypothetical protein
MSVVARCVRLVRNACLDLRYGRFLGGTTKTPYAHLGVEDTASTDYAVLPFIFTKDIVQESDVLVDIGCGKGRVINWWLSRGLANRLVGIELDEAVAQKTKRRLRRYTNVEIICGDALARLPEDGTLFYLFNPFTEPWVLRLKEQLELLFAKRRGITVFYYNCVFGHVFRNDPHWVVEEITLNRPFHRLAVIRMQKQSSGQRPAPSPRAAGQAASGLLS